MNLGNVLASIGSSYVGLCGRRRPRRLRCGDHGVKSIAFNAAAPILLVLGDGALLRFS